jgi:uncharacterized protein
VFVDHKFRGLFSLLFGAGIYLFTERAWARGSGRWLQLRRLCWLLVFGAIHYFLIWHGDILGSYAAAGMMALPMLRWPAARQLRVGIWIYVLGALVLGLGMTGAYLVSTVPEVAARAPADAVKSITEAPQKALQETPEAIALYGGDSYPAIVRHMVTEESGGYLNGLTFVPLTETLGLVLIGVALFRMGFFVADSILTRCANGAGGACSEASPSPRWWRCGRSFPASRCFVRCSPSTCSAD